MTHRSDRVVAPDAISPKAAGDARWETLPGKSGHRARPLEVGEIVKEARSWLGTPYRHQASLKGAGCDCLGLIRGVYRQVVGPEPVKLPAYARDWGDATGAETLLQAGRMHLVEIFVRSPGRLAPPEVRSPRHAAAGPPGLASGQPEDRHHMGAPEDREIEEIEPGDILVFRMRAGAPAKHAGILVNAISPTAVGDAGWEALPGKAGHRTRPLEVGEIEKTRMVHAQEGVGVVEVALGRWWRRRIVGAFRFPAALGSSPAARGRGTARRAVEGAAAARAPSVAGACPRAGQRPVPGGDSSPAGGGASVGAMKKEERG